MTKKYGEFGKRGDWMEDVYTALRERRGFCLPGQYVSPYLFLVRSTVKIHVLLYVEKVDYECQIFYYYYTDGRLPICH